MGKKRKYFIYKYTFPNGKAYVGQTYEGSCRFGNPKKYVNALVGNAMKKYPNFKKEILEYCKKENIDDKERFYINLFDTTNRDKGYNRDFGGNANKEFTADLKKHLSDVHLDLQVKKVIQYSQDDKFVKEWNSIKEASETLGIDRTSISKSIHGVYESAGGFVWRAVEQSPTYNKRPIS